MKFSSVVAITLLGQLASAAPFLHFKRNAEANVVVVTQTVETTVIITPGATQVVGQAATYAASSTSTSATPTPTSSSDDLVGAANVEDSSSSTTVSSTSSTESSTSSTESSTSTTSTPSPTTLSTSSTESTTSSSTSSTEAATSSSSDFQSQILNEHNAKRELHGVDALTWDDTLAQYAQAYADKYDCSGTLTHSGGQYGENLALGYSTTGTVDAWYSEGDNYDYGSSCSVYDHFTQVVWKSTTKVGCGYKHCNSYWGTYVVCSYDPAGNFVGECDSNVLPLSS
ncbi:hypothetical protein OGAPHI_004193 [Ogataea philodendri]|uniref:SCP domain-containing protein n=1 Tax=Ogataea philodendri TaxID=1378263 RepID=A0A9P8T572_9ASCO|nr:uncharacterized protein OGAPHI_004193 [Ogataea philodendri]KAH3666004.1 hypothetical protein OGAPHI_004193 [Ogataea philodendri]